MAAPPKHTNEAAQALAEDLAAVFSKHGLKVDGNVDVACIYPLGPDDRFVLIDDEGDLRFVKEKPCGGTRGWFDQIPFVPDTSGVAPIATSAHGRLAAAAHLAEIRKQQEAHNG